MLYATKWAQVGRVGGHGRRGGRGSLGYVGGACDSEELQNSSTSKKLHEKITKL